MCTCNDYTGCDNCGNCCNGAPKKAATYDDLKNRLEELYPYTLENDEWGEMMQGFYNAVLPCLTVEALDYAEPIIEMMEAEAKAFEAAK